MRNVFDVSVHEKSMTEYSDFLNSILKSPTPFKSGKLSPPEKKALLKTETKFSVAIVDVGESLI